METQSHKAAGGNITRSKMGFEKPGKREPGSRNIAKTNWGHPIGEEGGNT